MKKIIVYSISNCPYCTKVKRYLTSKKAEYEERNIELSKEYEKECRELSGDVSVPVTTLDYTSGRYVFKFDRNKIDELIELSKEGD